MKTVGMLYNLRTSLNKIFFKMKFHFKENCVYFAASIKLSPAAFIKSLFLLNIICLILLNLYLTYIVSPFLFNLILFSTYLVLKFLLTALVIVGYLIYTTLNIFMVINNIMYSLTSSNFYFLVAPLWYLYFPYFPMYKAIILISPFLLSLLALLLGFNTTVICIIFSTFILAYLLFLIKSFFVSNSVNLKSSISLYVNDVQLFSLKNLVLYSMVDTFCILSLCFLLFYFIKFTFLLIITLLHYFDPSFIFSQALIWNGCNPEDTSIFGLLDKVSFEEYKNIFQKEIISSDTIGTLLNLAVSRNFKGASLFTLNIPWIGRSPLQDYPISLKDNEIFIPQRLLYPQDIRDLNMVTYWVKGIDYPTLVRLAFTHFKLPFSFSDDTPLLMSNLSPELRAFVQNEIKALCLQALEDAFNLYRPEYKSKLDYWNGDYYKFNINVTQTSQYHRGELFWVEYLTNKYKDDPYSALYFKALRSKDTYWIYNTTHMVFIQVPGFFNLDINWQKEFNNPQFYDLAYFYKPTIPYRLALIEMRLKSNSYILRDFGTYIKELHSLRVDQAKIYSAKELEVEEIIKTFSQNSHNSKLTSNSDVVDTYFNNTYPLQW